MSPRHLHRPLRRAVAAAALLALGASAAQAEVTFQVTPIVAPGASNVAGFGLNDRGDVVGQARLQPGGPMQAFVWRDGVLTALANPVLGNGASTALAINDAGLVVGSVRDAANRQLPVQWLPGSTTGTLLSTETGFASAVNASGTALVTLTATNGVFNPNVFRTGPQGLVSVLPRAIGGGLNDAGTASGALLKDDGTANAFRITGNGTLRTLLALSPASSPNQPLTIGNAINNANQVAGTSTDAQGRERAVLWNAAGQVRNLGVLGSVAAPGTPVISSSRALALNDAGVVVGTSTSSSSGSAAFYWTERAGMQALPLASGGFAPFTATGVNELGQVLVNSTQGAALLTPTGRLFWGGGSGSFADATRWNPAHQPGLTGRFDLGLAPNRFLDASLGAQVQGQPAVASVVTLDRSTQVRSMVLGGLGSPGASVELRLSGPASPRTVLEVPNGMLVQANGILSGTGNVKGDVTLGRTLNGAGRIAAVDLRIEGALNNRGDIVSGQAPNIPGALFANVTNEAAGRVSAGADRALQVAGSAHTNLGVFEANGVRSQLRVFGNFANLAGGTVLAREGTVEINGIVTNEGTLRADPRGQLRLRSTLVNNGSVQANLAGRVTMEGVVTGAGSFGGVGTFEFLGGFAPGNSPALVSVGGNALFAGGDLVLDLGGRQAGIQHDQVIFTGSVAFAPGVALRLEMGDFQVQEGDRFHLFDFAQGAAGALDFAQLPVLGHGLRWDTADVMNGGWLGVSAVPEPRAWLLALAGLPLLRRRLRRAQENQ